MRRRPPTWSPRRYAVVALIVGAAGCQNQQAPLTNPFLAPNRVPPPSTRTIQPGTAQPYYPGDPLPVTQNQVAPTAQVASNSSVPTDGDSSWRSPGVTPPQEPAAGGNSPAQFAAANERPVGVPSDGEELRFELPSPPPEEPPAAAPPQLAIAAAPGAPPVQPASYDQPQPPPSDPLAGMASYTAPVDPWRPPQIPQPEPTPAAAQLAPPTAPPAAAPAPQPIAIQTAPVAQPIVSPVVPLSAAPPAFPQTTTVQPQFAAPPEPTPALAEPMDVWIKPVPPAQPVEPAAPSSAPRIRIPSQLVPPSPVAAPPGMPQANYYGAALPPGAVLQTVQVTELPPAGQMASHPTVAMGPAPQPADSTPVSRDGFRPRGSTP